MKVYEAVARAVKAEGCETVFGLLGDANMGFWQALHCQGGVRICSARHEAAAVAMADGHARACGGVGVATVTSGPGLTQLGTSLLAAARNRTPLVLVVGDVPMADLNNVQKFDQRRFVQACECEFVPITGAGNVAREMAEAFHIARTRRRPVAVNLPGDVQEQSIDWDFDYRPARDFLVPAPAPDVHALEQLADELLAAERPVIVAGWGAKVAGAREALIALADHVGALLATSLKAKGLFLGHDWDVGLAGAFAAAPAEEVLAGADFVLGVGAELGYYTTEGGLLFPDAKVARIDVAPSPPDLGVLPGLYVRGDAAAATLALLEAVRRRLPKAREGSRTAAARAALDGPSAPREEPGDGMDPRALASALAHVLPADAVVTIGAGHFWAFPLMYGAMGAEVDIHLSYQFGAIGQTLPLSLGIGIARAGRPHLVMEGDGAAMMNLQELESFAREKVPAVVLIWNDCGFGAEVHKLRAKKFEPELGRWSVSPDFVGVARALGGDGERVSDPASAAAAVRRGFACGGLFLIDARVSPSVVSDPYLKLQYGVPNQAPLLRRPGAAK